ncbi:hypothetical protein V6N13_147817 [Hibiscus sabdariffa]
MINAISSGARAVFLMGAHTNFAIFLMTCPHLKKNVEHIYAMGGSVRPYCLKNDGSDNSRECSDIGHLYPQDSSPYAEFNIFSDPFAAYEVLHSGIPFTLIPLDATNTVPNHEGENEFAEMQYMNITAVTLNLNQPYGALGGSNPLITGIQCQSLMYTRCSNGNARSLLPSERKRKMSDNANRTGWLDERRYRDGNVSVLVAVKGKANQDEGSTDHSIRECKLSDSDARKSLLLLRNFYQDICHNSDFLCLPEVQFRDFGDYNMSIVVSSHGYIFGRDPWCSTLGRKFAS